MMWHDISLLADKYGGYEGAVLDMCADVFHKWFEYTQGKISWEDVEKALEEFERVLKA